WLGFCRANHTRACQSSVDVLEHLPMLKVIDCADLSIIPLPAHQAYAALSYVWGPVQPPHVGRRNSADKTQRIPLPEPLPPLIVDAIQATKSLGLNYLWIDQYCIDQSDAADKMIQIQNMDLIYDAADFAIITASGSDPSHGLPGVGHTPRISQTCVEINNAQFVSTLPAPHVPIQGSKWFTRGWTFQEGILSRRRLVFTPQQVYFECNGMQACE
ncbi:HET-domain-containing protein, partial [Trematosphaeria pertusa]